jgi:hypothetical protein
VKEAKNIVTIPTEPVRIRAGAVPTRDMVVVLEESATKSNVKASTSTSGAGGLDLETVLAVQAWVARGPEPRYSWLDVHVFDADDQLFRSETVPLRHVRRATDDGEVYGFEGSVYRGTGASPGSVWLAPDARKVQYRLYSESGGQVYTDGLLRQHELPADSELTFSAEPASRRTRAKPALATRRT